MPFINGRYHVNPAMGQALEAAREAEAALLALQRQARKNSADASTTAPADDSADPEDPSSADADDDAVTGAGPIHHVEIEATELVPSNSGRSTRGFVARVHRTPAESSDSPTMTQSAAPETHIFSDHGDLVNFLRDALAKHSAQS
jgi:hypothetical protein